MGILLHSHELKNMSDVQATVFDRNNNQLTILSSAQ